MPRTLRVPPLPPVIQMQDRQDGTWWTLTHRQSDNRWAINDDPLPFAIRGQVQRWGPYDGPTVDWGKGTIRLLIRGGRIGYEVVDFGVATTDRDNARVMTRRGTTAYSLEITQGGWQREGDTLGWQVGLGTES